MISLGLFSGFLACVFAPQARATSIEDFTFTSALVDPDCSPPPPTTEFLTSDPRISLWVRLHDVRVGDTYTYSWFDPTGKLFHRHSLTRDDEAAETCTWSSITLQGGLAATRPGRWRVQLTYNGITLIEEYLLLGESGRLDDARLTSALPDLSPNETVPPSTSIARVSQPVLSLDMQLSELRAGDSYSVRWIDPTGTSALVHTLPVEADTHKLSAWSVLPLAGGLSGGGLAGALPAGSGQVGGGPGSGGVTGAGVLNGGAAGGGGLTGGPAGPGPASGAAANGATTGGGTTGGGTTGGGTTGGGTTGGGTVIGGAAGGGQAGAGLVAGGAAGVGALPGGQAGGALTKSLVPGRWRAEISINGQVRRVLPFVLRADRPPEVRADLKALYGDGAGTPCSSKLNPIEMRLLPHGGRLYRDPTAEEADRLEEVLAAVAAGRYELAESIAETLQLSVNRYIDARIRRPVWVIEPALPGRGPGFSVLIFYRPDGDPALIAEIPHPDKDDRTVDYGIELLRQGASMLIVAGADASSNYRPIGRLVAPLCAMQLSDAELVPGLDESDVVHNEDSMFHRVHTWAVDRAVKAETSPVVVQFHGYGDDIRAARTPATRGCDHSIILSNGVLDQAVESPLLVDLGSQLSRYPLHGSNRNSRYDYNIYVRSGQDCSAMNAAETVNVQARQTRMSGGFFLSVALDEEMRSYPTEVDARQLGEAIWDTYLGSYRDPEAPPVPRPARPGNADRLPPVAPGSAGANPGASTRRNGNDGREPVESREAPGRGVKGGAGATSSSATPTPGAGSTATPATGAGTAAQMGGSSGTGTAATGSSSHAGGAANRAAHSETYAAPVLQPGSR